VSGNQNYFCSYCGASIAPNDMFCNNCGQSVAEPQAPQPTYTPPKTETVGSTSYIPPSSQPGYASVGYQKPAQEQASTGLIILSFIIPLVGIILAIVKASNGQNQAAKAYGIAAVVAIVLGFFLNFIPFF
jgi:uncharacterized membrane protein YvbJ